MRRFKVLQKLARQNVDRWPGWDIVLELEHRETDPAPAFMISYAQWVVDWDDGQDPVVYTRNANMAKFEYAGAYPTGKHVVKFRCTQRTSNTGGTINFGTTTTSNSIAVAYMPQVTRLLKFDASRTVDGRPILFYADYLFNRCLRLESVDCEIDIGKIVSMQYAFRYCTRLAGKIVIANASGTLQTLNTAFHSCCSLEEIRFGDLPNMTNMASCFLNCWSLKRAKFGSFGKTVNWSQTFYRDSRLETVEWKGHANFSTLYQTFYNCSDLAELPEIADQPYCVSLNATFQNCNALKTVELGSFPSVTSAQSCFDRCYEIDHIHLSGLQKLQYCNQMFYICRTLSDFALEGFGPSVISMANMFNGAINLTGDIVLGDLPYATTLNSAFVGTNIRSLTIGDCPLLTDIANMCANLRHLQYFKGGQMPLCRSCITAFNGCQNMETCEIHIPDNTISQASEMFARCFSLKRLEGEARLRDTGPTNASYFNSIFYACFSLEEIPDIFPTTGWADAFAVPTATFGNAFQFCSRMKGTLPRWVWEDWGGNKTSQNSAFNQCIGLTNIEEIPGLWKGGDIIYND